MSLPSIQEQIQAEDELFAKVADATRSGKWAEIDELLAGQLYGVGFHIWLTRWQITHLTAAFPIRSHLKNYKPLYDQIYQSLSPDQLALEPLKGLEP